MNSRNDEQAVVTDKVLAASLQEQKAKGPALRQVHSKSHGLVTGKFKIEENIPEQCKIGVFTKVQEYDVWVRFSNASSPKSLNGLKPDTEGDARGMAIQLRNIKGNQVPEDESNTQDFILINHHVFFLPDVQGYIDFREFQEAIENGISPSPELVQKLAPSLAIAKQMSQKIIGNPLLVQYWSTTPYKLGSRFIKFSVKPSELEVPPNSIPTSPNYLREAMSEYLTHRQATFDFLVQFYVDEDKTPIENPMQEWQEIDSPFTKVATITIPPQVFDSIERKELDESLSFTPWHTLPEHEPVGSINLSRRKIYHEGAKARRSFSQTSH
ncbi:catalase family protein [Leptolyngbya sp. DQ-M1]|uniref:catalase family protein n=1 Tax=Leptolyngbya sp. DQ-M1 TaxID=2933920 RepID=UPI0032994CF7